MRLSVLLTLPLLVAGCATYLPRYAPLAPGAETGFYGDIETPELALLEYRIAKYLDWDERPYATICAAAERDHSRPAGEPISLPTAVEQALLRRFAQLSPLSECRSTGVHRYAGPDGSEAAVFQVEQPSCETATACTAYARYHAAGGGFGNRYALDWDGRQWRLRYHPQEIILTGEDQ